MLDFIVSLVRGGSGGCAGTQAAASGTGTMTMTAAVPSKAEAAEKGQAGSAGLASISTDLVLDANPQRRARVLCGVLLGDFVHNLCDGTPAGGPTPP